MHRRLKPGLHLLLLLFAALSMRAFVPPGYMPAGDAGGGIAVELCRSDGVWIIPVEDSGEQEHGRDAAPCAFAGLSGAAAPPAETPQPVAPAPIGDVFSPFELAEFAAADRPDRPPARAPPVAV